MNTKKKVRGETDSEFSGDCWAGGIVQFVLCLPVRENGTFKGQRGTLFHPAFHYN